MSDNLRLEYAAHLRERLGDAATIYAAGAEILATPAVVINPADPYMVPVSFGGRPAVQVMFDVHLITNRSDPISALAHLESLRLLVTDASKKMIPAGFWSAFGQWESTEVAGAVYASAVVSVMFKDSDR